MTIPYRVKTLRWGPGRDPNSGLWCRYGFAAARRSGLLHLIEDLHRLD